MGGRTVDPGQLAISTALERAAVAVGRLDDALAGHPLLPGWTHWAGLEAACRHAAADGWKADPYRLAAFVEGLPLRAVGTSAAERGRGHDAVAQAFARRSWLACPDADQAALLAYAEDHLATAGPRCPALLAAAWGMHGWLAGRGSRDAVRAAVPRHLHRRGLTRGVLPALTANDALKPDPDDRIDDPDAFARRFLAGVARESEAGRDRLRTMEYAWREGRGTVEARDGKRSTSRLPRAVDVLAAACRRRVNAPLTAWPGWRTPSAARRPGPPSCSTNWWPWRSRWK
jgi:hypothetical protein